MSTIVSFNGSSYTIPANGDSNWGSNVSSYLIAISTGTLQRSGGTFTLTAELNFGTSFGLKSLYYKSTAANPSSAGVFKLGNNESIGWRNAGNTADFLLKVNASDALQYNSKTFLFSGEIVNADISASAAIALSKLAALTTSKALVSDGSGIITASTVTSTELGYLSGVASSIQTQLDGKQASGSYALTTGKLSQFAATTSAELAGVISDETGTGSLVFSNSPSFTTPSLGVATATSINATTIPSTKTLVVTTDKLNVMAATSSSELAGIISDETGSGSLVFSNSPSFTTPSLGAATATSINSTTIPSSKTLVVTTDKLSALAATSSSELAGVISDETGSGSLVFATSPTLTTPVVDILTVDGQASTPSTPSSGFYKTYIKDSTGKLTVLDSSGVERSAGGVSAWGASTPYSVGDLVTYGIFIYSCLTSHTSSSTMETDLAGTSPKWKIVNTQPTTQNLMTYGADFECGDTSGWTAVGCATVTNGLLVSAGSGGAAFSAANGGRTKGANTTSPAVVSSGQLDGLYSLNFATSGAGTIGDMYISSTYKIPIAYQSTVLQVKFKYKVVSGTPVMSGTSSNTYAAAIYDIDNNSWSTMALVGNFNFVQSSGVGTFTGTFQVPYNSTQFQIAIYNPVAPTGASSLYVDDFYVGPQITSTGPAISDLKAYTPTLTNFGNGTAALCYKQEGNLCKIKGILLVGSSLPTGQIKFTLPTGLSADFTYLTKGLTGIDAFQKVGLATSYAPGFYSAAIIRDNTSLTTFYFNGETSAGFGGNADWSNVAPTTWTVSDVITVDMEIPISGWSSNTVMSADTDTRVVSAQVYGAAANVTALNPVIYPTKIKDDFNCYSTTTGKVTVPVTGYYQVSTTIVGTFAAASTLYCYIDGSNQSQPLGYSTTVAGHGNATYYATAGQTIDVRCSQNITSISATTGLSIQRLSGPAVIAAADSIIENWCDTAGGNITSSGNTVVFNSKNVSQTGSYNSSTGIFTAPVSANYSFAWRIQTVAQTPTTSQSVYSTLQKNGSD